MNKIFKIIRKFTIPPVFAAALLIVVYAAHADYFGSIWQLVGGLFFLSVLPTLAYPLQKYIPRYRDKGREGQRGLAMIFSFLGYMLGTVSAYLFSAPIELKLIYMAYLLCGIGMLVLNKVFGVKASGHACGIVGPVILFLYFGLYLPAIIGMALILPVYISSMKTKQHTWRQLISGSGIPAVVIFLIAVVNFLSV